MQTTQECKTNTAALEQVCLGLNSAFCYLPVLLQDLQLPALVRAHVCERLDHTLNLFAVTPCDMQQYYRLIGATDKHLSGSHMMTLCLPFSIEYYRLIGATDKHLSGSHMMTLCLPFSIV